MAPRDYELEQATAVVADALDEPVVRALFVGLPGSEEGTLGGAFKTMFGRARRDTGMHARNVLVLTPSSIRLFACRGRGWPPAIDHETASWPVGVVRVAAETAEQWSAFNASHSGSQTNRYYRITLTPSDGGDPVVVECARTDSARATIQALEDATGSPPSKITARRRRAGS